MIDNILFVYRDDTLKGERTVDNFSTSMCGINNKNILLDFYLEIYNLIYFHNFI